MAANDELIRLIDSIHRDKGIDKEYLFRSLEGAILQASQKRLESAGELRVTVDRLTGEIAAYEDGCRIDPGNFGRIAAQTAKQVMIQKIREAESEVIYDEFETKKASLITGHVQRIEHGAVIVNLGRSEALLPRQEQVFSEQYRPGDRIRAYVLDVKRQGQKVSIILSRAHPGLVSALFGLEVPEISDRVVEIKSIVREAGHRTKVAVFSSDARIDPVGSCVGMRGARIRNIVDELGGEKIDIIRWSDSPDVFVRNSLKPAEVTSVEFDREEMRARVTVPEDQLSLAIGRKGQNVRLTAKLTGWGIDILTEDEARQEKEFNLQEMHKLPGIAPDVVERMMMAGFKSIAVIARKGIEALSVVKGLTEEDIARIHAYALVRAKEIEAERQAAVEAAAAARAAAGAISESLGEAAPPEENEPASEPSAEPSEELPAEPAVPTGDDAPVPATEEPAEGAGQPPAPEGTGT